MLLEHGNTGSELLHVNHDAPGMLVVSSMLRQQYKVLSRVQRLASDGSAEHSRGGLGVLFARECRL